MFKFVPFKSVSRNENSNCSSIRVINMAALVRLKRGSVQLRHAALEMKGMGKFFFHADTRTMIPSFDKYETTF